MSESAKPLIVGAGLAGLVTALCSAPRPVRLLVRGRLGHEGSSLWAQGGLAAAVGPGDAPGLHAEDTIRAAGGLADPDVVARITQAGPWAIEYLARLGVPFDRGPQGDLELGLEGGHSRHRIVHAGGDATGRVIMETLIRQVRATPSIEIIEGFEARCFERDETGIVGVSAEGPGGVSTFPASQVVLATGGVGGLFPKTTNPPGSQGQGLLMALLAGASLIDMEFIQYHPTALDTGTGTLPLISEAVRGDGATLIDENGTRILRDAPRGELEPRDRVARAVWSALAGGHRVFLDARHRPGSDFPERFPSIHAVCLACGLDPRKDLLPVCPAVHYHMGGVEVDPEGRSTIAGLWAVGEVAATGLHGANRLASNSLLEAVVCGHEVARSLLGTDVRPRARRAAPAEPLPSFEAHAVADILGRSLGVVRNGAELESALAALERIIHQDGLPMAWLGWVWVLAAYRRCESRGAHFRKDHPDLDPAGPRRQRVSRADWESGHGAGSRRAPHH